MGSVKKQLRKFVNEQIGPHDLVAIIRTGGTLGALQQFTNDRRLIDAAMNQVKWNICSRVGTTVLPPVGGLVPLNMSSPCGMSASSIIGTLRALRFIVEAMGEIPGRKSMVIFSDSLPREEQDFTDALTRIEGTAQSGLDASRNFGYLLQRVAEKAIRSSVVIYAVDAGGLQFTGITAADDFSRISSRQMNQTIRNTMSSRSLLIQQRREGAELIAKQTGGFLVRNSNDFQLDRVLEDQSGYYLIGYRPTDETFNRKFHHIKARVKKSGMTLRTRYGFFGVSEDEVARSKRTPVDKTMVALLSPFRAQEISVDLNAFFTNDKAGSYIRLFVVLNGKDLTFRDTPEGWHEASVQLREIIVGNNGAIADQQTFDRTISLRGDTYEQALREGIMFHLDLPVRRPGAYQVRVAARDVATSKVGAVGQFVEIPDLNNGQLALSGIVLGGAIDGDSSNAKEAKVSPTVRRYPSGSNVRFGFGIYNALIDPASHQPNVTIQLQLYRDGKQVFSSPILPVDTKNQADLARIVTTGVLSLNPELEPGSYYLQIIATDALTKEKHSQAMQWIDFEIVK
jgi:hypothetical protein